MVMMMLVVVVMLMLMLVLMMMMDGIVSSLDPLPALAADSS